MRKILSILIVISLSGFCARDFYSLSCKKLSGENIPMNSFRNKNVMFVVLPVITDSSFLDELDSLATAHAEQVKIIGITPYEYANGHSLADIKNFYNRHLGSSVTVTEIMKTARNIQQHPLVKWLTSKEDNVHFDVATVAPGIKFIVNPNGEEYACFDNNVPITSESIWSTIH